MMNTWYIDNNDDDNDVIMMVMILLTLLFSPPDNPRFSSSPIIVSATCDYSVGYRLYNTLIKWDQYIYLKWISKIHTSICKGNYT